MRKKSFIKPNILLSAGSGGPGSDIGHGSGQGTTDLINPMSLAAWLDSDYAEDLIENDVIDFNDYVAWWGGMMELNPFAFSQEAWQNFGNDEIIGDWDDFFGD